eukprot:CAMPEP_0167771216 /NCGR_PEP_ID=MMETSP0111_2-20121227/154_1 /TAXON_ID=91324 /ORGANISM="Lotharella globosa, Strain CCCM811" /LENGTH=143 /DNA_ID=CAMNT_0007660543 /DNA_START=46 /DNA_END=477 /DNA_ORIENTATION=-
MVVHPFGPMGGCHDGMGRTICLFIGGMVWLSYWNRPWMAMVDGRAGAVGDMRAIRYTGPDATTVQNAAQRYLISGPRCRRSNARIINPIDVGVPGHRAQKVSRRLAASRKAWEWAATSGEAAGGASGFLVGRQMPRLSVDPIS